MMCEYSTSIFYTPTLYYVCILYAYYIDITTLASTLVVVCIL